MSPGVAAGVVGAEVDEHALNEEVTDLEHVTPAAGAPVPQARASRPERVGGGRSGSSPEPCGTPAARDLRGDAALAQQTTCLSTS